MNKHPKNTTVIATRKSYGGTLVVYYCSKHKVELYGGAEKVPLEVCGFYIKTGGSKNES